MAEKAAAVSASGATQLVCFTCLQHTADLTPIQQEQEMDETTTTEEEHQHKEAQSAADFLAETNGHRGSVLAKHFWFDLHDLLRGFICAGCWSRIEEFHRFYSEIEEIHERNLYAQLVEVKEEEEGEESDGVEQKEDPEGQTVGDQGGQEVSANETADGTIICIEEHLFTEEENDDDDDDDEDYEAEELEDEAEPEPDLTTKQTRKRTRRKQKLADRLQKADELIAKYCNMHCDQCQLEFQSFGALQLHSAAIHQQKAYVFCCDRKFNKRTRLFEHVQRHMNPERFQCDVCKRNCVDSEGLKRHKLKVHTPLEERPFRCPKCPKAFVSEALLNNHRNYHTAMETKEFPCAFCDRFFGNASLLKAHEKNNHASTYEFVCDTCAKGFNQRGPFLRHLQEHGPKQPEEKVQCPICARWLLKVSMNKHILRHNSPTYRCEICGKESPNVLAHKSHLRFAHSEARFTCNFCGKVFKRAITLKEHIASHSGEVLYTCPHCPKTFNSNANMHAHRKKMHHQEWLATKESRFGKQQE